MLCLASLCLSLGASFAARDGFDDALRLVAEGRLSAALRAADGVSDPLRRAQAIVHVRHRAGDLGGALAAGLSGLRSAPADPWLLEQAAYIAISLRQAELAGALCRKLSAGAGDAELSPDDARRMRLRATQLGQEAEQLQDLAHARVRALRAAKGTVYVALALALVLLAALSRRPVARV